MGRNCFELCERFAVDIKPNVLSLRLSINASRLFRDYGIRYQNSRNNTTEERFHFGKKPSRRRDNGVKGVNVLRAARCEKHCHHRHTLTPDKV